MKKIVTAIVIFCSLASSQVMAEPMLGEVRIFGFNFCPRGWAPTNGQLLAISQNQALFSLLGTNFGGDGRSTFGLPDLRGRVVVGVGQGPGLSSYRIGQKGGVEKVTLNPNQLPAHNHAIVALSGKGNAGAAVSYTSKGKDSAAASTSNTGGSQPHENRTPFLAMTSCIALQGIYPSRN